jgi:DNA-binding transcriptional regulator WhiA
LVENKDITFSIQYRDFKPKVNNVAHIFSFDSSRITIRYSESHKFSAYHIQINGAVFRLVFERFLDWFLNSNFLENEDLRRGFLRGVFAAEGCVAVQWKEMYINDIEFSAILD